MAAQRKPLPTDEIVKAYKGGASAKALGLQHGCTQGTILRVLREAKVPIRPRGGTKRVKLPVARVVRQYTEKGLSTTALAQKHGCSASTITRLLESQGVTLRPRNAKAESAAA